MTSNNVRICKNCETKVNGDFCWSCGQKVKEGDDRSIFYLIRVFLSNFFFIDNRIFVSTIYLLFKPGVMSKQFIDGKRKKFLPPITLFLFVNLFYFLVSPSTDYSLSLYDQTHHQPYSEIAQSLVNNHIKENNLNLKDYSVEYKSISLQVSKSLMLLNIPIITFFLFLFTFKKRKFYFDNLIYVAHYFTFFLVCTLVSYYIGQINNYFGNLELFFVLVFPLIYAIIGARNFYSKQWYLFVPIGILSFLAIFITLLFYRAIIFGVTYLFV